MTKSKGTISKGHYSYMDFFLLAKLSEVGDMIEATQNNFLKVKLKLTLAAKSRL
ncbi:hypothetical protein [Bacteroides thetaiotaomicron]|uniref:hypothetical protein n=1 Tax=Bacteroides thetaiotaomicron TaxID=818 RepID=UPI00159EEAB1|nr:hypothetical protein [Bacteroides thetaiotaomicron]